MKSILIILIYSTMIVGLPIVAGFFGRLRVRGRPGRETDLLVAAIALVFVLATLKSVADVTQVAQLGRYYAPVYVLMLPTAVAGLNSTGPACVASGVPSSRGSRRGTWR